MKRKIIIILALVLTVIAVIGIVNIVQVKLFAVDIHIPFTSREGKYMIKPSVSAGVTTPAQNAAITEYGNVMNEFLTEFYEENKDKIYKIECEVTVTKDTTTIRYFGTITDPETNETVDYEKEIVLDFILGKNLIGFHESSA